MEIWLDEELLKVLYDVLVKIYRETDYPITVGYNEGMIGVCIERPLTGVYDFIPFPHFLHKAAVLMETIVNFHPFADGNKRVALLATFYFLYWNGYDLTIPKNADEFTIEIAKGKRNLNDILSWLSRHSKRGFSSILRNLFCGICITLWEDYSVLEGLVGILVPLFLPLYPFLFFREKIAGKRKNQTAARI
jgi:death-on-curing protein